MSRLRAELDEALFGPESAARLVFTQQALAATIAIRLAITPFHRFTDLPDALVFMVPVLRWLPGMPSAAVIVVAQVVGVIAAVVAAARRWPRVTFAIAWLAYLFLAGLRASRGKVLHNDLLLLWVSAVFLLAPVGADRKDLTPRREFGWPIRSAIAVTALIYWFSGYHKLRRSGPGWVFGDNMAYVMRWGPRAGEPRVPEWTHWVGDHVLIAQLTAAFIIGLELLFPLVIWWRRARPLFAVAAVVLHIGTWLLLGLDYSMWVVTVLIVLIDWPAALAGFRGRRTPVRPLAEGQLTAS